MGWTGNWRDWVLTGDQTGEEGLAVEILVVLLEVLLAGLGELDGSELEAAVLEALDDGTNEATLYTDQHTIYLLRRCIAIEMYATTAIVRGVWRTWTPSGLIAMKLFPTISYTAFRLFTPLRRAIEGQDVRLLGSHVCGVEGFDVLSKIGSVSGTEFRKDGRVGDARGERRRIGRGHSGTKILLVPLVGLLRCWRGA